MAKCKMCGKTPAFGHNVSHSSVKTKRQWKPNIQKVTVYKEHRTKPEELFDISFVSGASSDLPGLAFCCVACSHNPFRMRAIAAPIPSAAPKIAAPATNTWAPACTVSGAVSGPIPPSTSNSA